MSSCTRGCTMEDEQRLSSSREEKKKKTKNNENKSSSCLALFTALVLRRIQGSKKEPKSDPLGQTKDERGYSSVRYFSSALCVVGSVSRSTIEPSQKPKTKLEESSLTLTRRWRGIGGGAGSVAAGEGQEREQGSNKRDRGRQRGEESSVSCVYRTVAEEKEKEKGTRTYRAKRRGCIVWFLVKQRHHD